MADHILSCTPEGDCHRLTLHAPQAAAAYTAAGQYCTLRIEGRSGYFAMAHAPGALGDRLQFIVKPGGDAADRLLSAAENAQVEVGPPAGAGYPMDAALQSDAALVFIGTGTGAAALRAPIEVARAAGRSFTLYQGHRHRTPFSMEISQWRAEGHQVVTCLSKPPKSWTGPTGYVQDLVAAEAPDWSSAWVFVCAQSPVLDAVREMGPRFGLPAGRLSTNY